jgi:hypothetical protein
MRLMQPIGRIAPGALIPPPQSKSNCFVAARGEFSARGAIGLIRSFRRIRVEPLNLDASNDVAVSE